MEDIWILMLVGFITCIGGFLLKKREKKLFENPVNTHAKVVGYDEYMNYDNTNEAPPIKMYTMLVEYTLKDGTLVRAKHQSGSSHKKYEVGKILPITYSSVQTDMFVLKGDKTRDIVFIGMIIVGAVMVILPIYLMFKQ